MSYADHSKHGSTEPLRFLKSRISINFPHITHHNIHSYWIWDMFHFFLLKQPDWEQVSLHMAQWFSGLRMRVPDILVQAPDQRTNARSLSIIWIAWVYYYDIPMEIQYFSAPDFMLICKSKVPISPELNVTSFQPQVHGDIWFIFIHGEWNITVV